MKKRIILYCALSAVFIVILLITAIYNGIILLNNPSKMDFPVRGVDVSSYQGDIDWKTIKAQGIQFAFIKATEGSSLVDKYFESNYKNAIDAGLRIGAYHFFSYDSSALTQAENFISNVPVTDNMLPPVVDVEFYADYEKNPPDVELVQKELSAMLSALQEHYSLKPIIYATEKSYSLYIKDRFEAYDIWIRNVVTAPRVLKNNEWTFWQYTNRAVLDGYNGKEKYIDLNVFNGTAEEFENYPQK